MGQVDSTSRILGFQSVDGEHVVCLDCAKKYDTGEWDRIYTTDDDAASLSCDDCLIELSQDADPTGTALRSHVSDQIIDGAQLVFDDAKRGRLIGAIYHASMGRLNPVVSGTRISDGHSIRKVIHARFETIGGAHRAIEQEAIKLGILI